MSFFRRRLLRCRPPLEAARAEAFGISGRRCAGVAKSTRAAAILFSIEFQWRRVRGLAVSAVRAYGGMQARRVIAGRFQEKMPRTRGSRACTGRGILTLTIRLVSLLLSSTLQRSLILVRVPKPAFSSPRCVMNFALSRQAPQFLRCESRFEEKGDDGWGKNIDGTDSEGYSWLGVTARSTHSGPTQPLRTR